MIDKYKRPRVQRLVPWRSPATRRASVVLQAMRGIDAVQAAVAAEVERSVIKPLVAHWARLLLQSIAAEEAFESGALPGEFLPRELRHG